jgi:AraC-like DNA-binding protein
MAYFDDIRFMTAAESRRCTARVADHAPETCSLELSLGGAIVIATDGRPARTWDQPVLFWHHPRHRYRYHPAPKPGWWHHHYVLLGGPRAQRLLLDGFIPLSPDHALGIRRSDEVRSLFHGLMEASRDRRRWMHAAILVDRLLALAIEESERIRPPDRHARAIASFASAVEDDPAATIDLEAEAQRIGVSAVQFRRLCHRQLGTSPLRFIRRRRMEHAARTLAGGASVAAAAEAAGYVDQNWFSRDFHRIIGLTPSRVRDLGWTP